MGTTGPGKNSDGRDGPRASIFRAARSLAERDGVEGLTLGKIAIEANLPRPVVYGLFIRKEDLLLAVAADSVAKLAHAIGGIDEAHKASLSEGPQESAVVLTLPRPEPLPESAETMVGIAREVSAAMGASSEVADLLAASGTNGRGVRRVERSRGAENFTRISPPGEAGVADQLSEQSDNASRPTLSQAPHVDAIASSIEKRFDEFARTIAEIDDRQVQLENRSTNAAAVSENGIKDILEKLNALAARVDETETRQKAAEQEARMAINDASVRLQTVEGVARAALVENGAAPAAEAVLELTAAQEQPTEQVGIEHASEADGAAAALQPSFLASARASAIAATALKPHFEVPPTKPKARVQTTYVAAGLVVTAIFVAAAGVAFSQGVRDGRNEALQSAALVAPSHSRMNTTARTPLDRLTQLAEGGDSSAELAIAEKYLNDPKASHDPVAGFRWMTRSAVHGNAVAEYMLGTLYQQGTGTAVNAVLAMRWYEAAAVQGNRKAMHNLGIGYAEGLAGVKSSPEAVRWLSRAANLGYVDSQFDLAVLYERGDGVPVSLLDAFKWYVIAAAQGDEESKSRIEALRTQLSSDDLAAAQHAANSFRPLPFIPAANLLPKI